ncbi:MAG: pantetheine-phosphate adenylyltransferase [Pseudomonadota bacterium]
MARRVGLYPGTFDPLTLGHVDIIERAVKLVDELIIAVAVNRDKGPLFTLDERTAMVCEEMARVEKTGNATIRVLPFDKLLMTFAEEQNVNIIVRGLRAVSDFEYEFQMVGMNQALNDEIETVFLMADARYQSIASRLVKEIARLDGDVTAFLPAAVATRVREKFASLAAAKS